MGEGAIKCCEEKRNSLDEEEKEKESGCDVTAKQARSFTQGATEEGVSDSQPT